MREELWNNSWVKNLLACPLAPWEENPGPAEPLMQPKTSRAGSKTKLTIIIVIQP